MVTVRITALPRRTEAASTASAVPSTISIETETTTKTSVFQVAMRNRLSPPSVCRFCIGAKVQLTAPRLKVVCDRAIAKRFTTGTMVRRTSTTTAGSSARTRKVRLRRGAPRGRNPSEAIGSAVMPSDRSERQVGQLAGLAAALLEDRLDVGGGGVQRGRGRHLSDQRL